LKGKRKSNITAAGTAAGLIIPTNKCLALQTFVRHIPFWRFFGHICVVGGRRAVLDRQIAKLPLKQARMPAA
jgi:hypothetical protein